MSDSLGELIGTGPPLCRMPKSGKARQVTTHSHERARIPLFYRRYRDVGHADFRSLAPGETWSFPELEGPGCVTSIWMTAADRLRELLVRRRVPAQRHLWIRVHYDGRDTPAIEAPLGHFFGNGTSRYVHFNGKFVGMTSGGYYSFLPMPFDRSCRISVENRHPSRRLLAFYGAVTYQQLPELPADVGRLHAQYRTRSFSRSRDVSGSSVPDDPHVLLEEETGPGKFVGTTLSIFPTRALRSRFRPPHFLFPYLEGNLKVYVDDEVYGIQSAGLSVVKPVGAPPGPQSIEWTGVEDYFLSGFYYQKGCFGGLYHGCPVRSVWSGVVSQYRFHELDPYPWDRRMRMTLTHGEFDHVDCRMESLAFYYKGHAEGL